ncbi:hypothetical protein, partial [Nocardiopsis tropica]
GDVWETLVAGTRTALYRAGGTWVWSGTASDIALDSGYSAERAMKEITWHLDVKPLIDAAQNSR